MLNALDEALLALARKTARIYRGLTGRDNFSLGRIFNIFWFGTLCFFILQHAVPFGELGYMRPIFFTLAGVAAICNALNLNLSEEQANEDALQGAKKLGSYERLRKERLVWFFVDVQLWTIAVFQRITYPSSQVFFFAIAVAGIVVIAYLRSIEKPPYARFRLPVFFRQLATQKIRR